MNTAGVHEARVTSQMAKQCLVFSIPISISNFVSANAIRDNKINNTYPCAADGDAARTVASDFACGTVVREEHFAL